MRGGIPLENSPGRTGILLPSRTVFTPIRSGQWLNYSNSVSEMKTLLRLTNTILATPGIRPCETRLRHPLSGLNFNGGGPLRTIGPRAADSVVQLQQCR
jgi:hypothetical protein